MQIDITPLMEYSAMLVAAHIDEKAEKKVAPTAASLREMLVTIQEELKEALRRHVREGLLKCYKDLNGDVYFEYQQPKR